MSYSTEKEFATAVTRETSLLARTIQGELVGGSLTKADRSPVTIADFAVQAVIARRLQEFDSAAVLVGEESAAELHAGEGAQLLPQITRYVRQCIPTATDDEVLRWIDRGAGDAPDRFWTLDPIDGTKGFLRGDQYVVALALISGSEVQVGALGCPRLDVPGSTSGEGMLALATRGGGARCRSLAENGDWQSLKVSGRSKPAEARLLRSVESGHTNTGAIGELIATLGVAADAVPLDSQAKYAMLAAGEGDVLLRLLSSSHPDYREKIWDQAAGSIVVEEAGGRVSDLDGKPLDFSHGRSLAENRGILSTNGTLHEPFLEGLRQIGA